MSDNHPYLNFDEYIRQGEPAMKERADAWRVAIGLQAVDGLTTSDYLKETARKNIEGEVTIDEARERIRNYYITKTVHDKDYADKYEADNVSGIKHRQMGLINENKELTKQRDELLPLLMNGQINSDLSYDCCVICLFLTNLSAIVNGIFQIFLLLQCYSKL